jgi:hypothetical protein
MEGEMVVVVVEVGEGGAKERGRRNLHLQK